MKFYNKNGDLHSSIPGMIIANIVKPKELVYESSYSYDSHSGEPEEDFNVIPTVYAEKIDYNPTLLHAIDILSDMDTADLLSNANYSGPVPLDGTLKD